jgi:apolipoprotein N-acyltransferase
MTARAIVAATASGLLIWLATPAVGAGWLAWVALVPAASVALSDPGRPGRLAVPLSYAVYMELLLVPALPFGLADGQWGDPALPVLVGGSPVLPVALLAVPALAALLYLLRFGQPPRAAWLGPGAAAALAVIGPALVWTALDFVRVRLDPGSFWGPLFPGQAGDPAGQLAALGGPWLITLAVVAVNYGLALALVRRRAVAALVPAGAVVAAVLVAVPVSGAQAGGDDLVVAAVQPGYDTAEEERPELRFFDPGSYDLASLDLARDLGRLTRKAAARGAELVVWPEAAVWVDPVRNGPLRRLLARLASRTGAVLVVPYFLSRPDRGATVAVLPARGPGEAEFTSPRPKQRPMWYLGEGAASAPARPLDAGSVQVGTMLGVDTQDPHVAAQLGSRGAQVLTSSTHDWAQLAEQHRAFARTAARASGLPLVRADWRYGSAIYGASGELEADAGSERTRTVVVASVQPASGASPYASLGDALGWGALGAALLMISAGLLGRVPPQPRLQEPRGTCGHAG